MQWRKAMPTTPRVAHLTILVALTACNAVVFPSVGGDDGDDVCENCNRPVPQPVPNPTPRPTTEPAPSCILPTRVTAQGELVKENTDGGTFSDAGASPDASDAEPPPEPTLSSLDIEVEFQALGGTVATFGKAPTCTGCEVRRTSFNYYGGTITIRVPHTQGTVSAFSPAAVRIPFGCGKTSAVLTLKVFQKDGDSRVTVEGYATN